MAEDEEVSKDAELVRPQDPPPFLEVICKSSGKARRFAAGTEAGFAVSLINRKLEIGTPPALHIEAAKEGEEPISFGPNSVLTDYGNGWRLQTVTEFEGLRKGDKLQPTPMQFPTLKTSDGSQPVKKISQPGFSLVYVGKIALAFVLIFALGAIFTLALDNLPRLILLINSTV